VCTVWGKEESSVENQQSQVAGDITSIKTSSSDLWYEPKEIKNKETKVKSYGSAVGQPKPCTYTKKEKKSLQCQICGSTFARHENLKRHNKTSHENTVCICSICGSHLKNSTTLKNHMLCKHEREGPFPCQQCGRMFKNPYKYCRRHTTPSRLHGRSGELVACSRGCGYFADKRYISSHQKTSRCDPMKFMVKLFECEACGKKFTTEKYQKKHENVHIKGKPFMCSLCDMGFTERYNLMRHMNKNTCFRKIVNNEEM